MLRRSPRSSRDCSRLSTHTATCSPRRSDRKIRAAPNRGMWSPSNLASPNSSREAVNFAKCESGRSSEFCLQHLPDPRAPRSLRTASLRPPVACRSRDPARRSVQASRATTPRWPGANCHEQGTRARSIHRGTRPLVLVRKPSPLDGVGRGTAHGRRGTGDRARGPRSVAPILVRYLVLVALASCGERHPKKRMIQLRSVATFASRSAGGRLCWSTPTLRVRCRPRTAPTHSLR